jgi:ABC-type polysaccharide/polyol phosphate export permease
MARSGDGWHPDGSAPGVNGTGRAAPVAAVSTAATATTSPPTAPAPARRRGPEQPAPSPPDAPPADLLFKRRVRPVAMLRELIGAKELIVALTERDFRARYKQTKVGVAWAVLTPLLLLGAFSILANTAADFDTKGLPYPLFAAVALVPWTFFSNAVATGAVSITANLSLVNKVYCPREVFPLASIGTAGIDALISLGILGALFAAYGTTPEGDAVWVPVLLLVQVVFTMGVALVMSSMVVYLRDVRQVLPMALQFALFATPVAYSFDEIDSQWQPLASAINPLAPLIEGYRDTVLLGQPPDWPLVGISAAVSLVWLVGGYIFFKRLETGFADVA